jgi:hypothetical protein
MILPEQKETFDRLIAVLRGSGMLPHVMLIGSWAEWLLRVCCGKLRNPNILWISKV